MSEVIRGHFGVKPEPSAPIERTFGEAAGLKVGLRRIEAPYGDELQVIVSAVSLSVPRVVAVVLANPAGEDEADRIGKAVLEALRLADEARGTTVQSSHT